jgi:hypothetical protein
MIRMMNYEFHAGVAAGLTGSGACVFYKGL